MKTKTTSHVQEILPLTTVPEFAEKQSITKHERFLKYAGGRVAQALRSIELIGNCSNTQSYEYNYEEEVKPAFDQLRVTLDEAEAKFQPKTKQHFGRNFFKREEE